MNGIKKWLSCPHCGSSRVKFGGDGYRENGVVCKSCGLEEGDIRPPDEE
jgi:uncharacterized protein (DUF983 family)